MCGEECDDLSEGLSGFPFDRMIGVEGVRGIEDVEAVELDCEWEIGDGGGSGDELGDPRVGNGNDDRSSESGFTGWGEGTFEGMFFVSTVSCRALLLLLSPEVSSDESESCSLKWN